MQQVLLFSKIDKITDFLEPNVIDYINTKQTFAFESFENPTFSLLNGIISRFLQTHLKSFSLYGF